MAKNLQALRTLKKTKGTSKHGSAVPTALNATFKLGLVAPME